MADVNVALVRVWARAEGLPVGERGRIKPEIISAYVAAHGGQAPPSPAQKPARQEESSLVARPLATPGVAESYGADAAAVARNYVPNADRPDFTDEIVTRARNGNAAIAFTGNEFKLFRDKPIPTGAQVVLDFRQASR